MEKYLSAMWGSIHLARDAEVVVRILWRREDQMAVNISTGLVSLDICGMPGQIAAIAEGIGKIAADEMDASLYQTAES